jgi:hypothetical protein
MKSLTSLFFLPVAEIKCLNIKHYLLRLNICQLYFYIYFNHVCWRKFFTWWTACLKFLQCHLNCRFTHASNAVWDITGRQCFILRVSSWKKEWTSLIAFINWEFLQDVCLLHMIGFSRYSPQNTNNGKPRRPALNAKCFYLKTPFWCLYYISCSINKT